MTNFLSGLKNRIVHFFHDTATGQAIEKITLDIIGRGGMHDFLVKVEGEGEKALAAIFAAALSGASPADLFKQAEASIEGIAKDSALDFKTNWLKWVVSTLYEKITATNPAIAKAMESAPK